jgi:hypothetical protein
MYASAMGDYDPSTRRTEEKRFIPRTLIAEERLEEMGQGRPEINFVDFELLLVKYRIYILLAVQIDFFQTARRKLEGTTS